MRRQSKGFGYYIRAFGDSIPGKQTFGVFRFLPIFFFIGAGLEFTMIHWTVGETNFCKSFKFLFKLSAFTFSFLDRTYKRRRAQEIVDAELRSAKVES